MKRILFVYGVQHPMIQRDREFMEKNHSVKTFYFPYGKFFRMVRSGAEETVWLLRNIWAGDLVYIWFADYHALLPAFAGHVLHKKVMVCIGGYDAALVPELGYGAHLRPFRSFCARFSCDVADKIWVGSQFTKKEIRRFTANPHIEVVYPGVDEEFFSPAAGVPRDRITTVCSASRKNEILRKGGDIFLEVARRVPECSFLMIGVDGAALNYLEDLGIPDNVEIWGKVPHRFLRRVYQHTAAYCQFSRYEASGVSILEARAAGAIPIVFDVGGMPEMAAGAGIVVRERDPQALAEVVREVYPTNPGGYP